MNFQEALDLSWAKHGGHELPWEISKEAYTVIFQQGWHAHAESLKQADLFPGTWDKDGLANSSQKPLETAITAEDIYAAFPRKVGRGAAIKAINKALKIPQLYPTYLLAKVQAYAAAVATWPKDERKFCPHPATWFNQERYLDDPKEWQRGGATTSQFSKTY